MKKYFLTGLALLLPAALTLIVVVFLFQLLTAPFVGWTASLIQTLEVKTSIFVPGWVVTALARLLAFVFLSGGIFLLGLFARWFFVRGFLSLTHGLLIRIPLINTVYTVTKDILSALFSLDGKKVFQEPVFLPFPQKPSRCLGFRAGEVAKECQEKCSVRLVSVFAPTSPHPISGFLLLVPEEDIEPTAMSNEEAVKFLVSCGMVYPFKKP